MKVDQGHVSIGSVVGLYRIVRNIAAGRGGGLYEGQHLLLQTKVILKILGPELAGGRDVLDRFPLEAKNAARINHENVCKVLDVGRREDGFMFVAMEFFEGVTLAWALREAPLPWPRAKRIALQMAAGLGAAHSLSIVHGDIKPENVYLAKKGELLEVVKLLGFGVAKALSASALAATQRAATSGTRSYTAPEQIDGKAIDVATDVYAFGAVLYEMLTGGPMFTDRRSRTTPDRRLVDVPPPSVRRPDLGIPAAADAVILRALEVEPHRRWTDMSALGRAMEGIPDWPATGIDIGPDEVTPILPLASIQAWTGQSGEIVAGVEEPETPGPDPDIEISPLDPNLTSTEKVPTASDGRVVAAKVPGGTPPTMPIVDGRATGKTPTTPAPNVAGTPPPERVPPLPPPRPSQARLVVPAAAPARRRWMVIGGAGLAVALAVAVGLGLSQKPSSSGSGSGGQASAKPAVVPHTAPVVVSMNDERLPPPAGARDPEAAAEQAGGAGVQPGAGDAPRMQVRRPGPPAARAPGVRPGPIPGAAGPGPTAAPVPAAARRPAGAAAGSQPQPLDDGVIAPAAPARALEGNCTVTLGSRPGSEVWIDGARLGPTPIVARSLACGKHQVAFRAVDQGLEREETIVLQPGQLLRRSIDLTKGPGDACAVTLSSQPWSEVWIDNRRAGTTPLVGYAVSCGHHDIVFRNNELQLSHRESIDVKPDEVPRRVVNLEGSE
jgi:serine/threonine-protein kinase